MSSKWGGCGEGDVLHDSTTDEGYNVTKTASQISLNTQMTLRY